MITFATSVVAAISGTFVIYTRSKRPSRLSWVGDVYVTLQELLSPGTSGPSARLLVALASQAAYTSPVFGAGRRLTLTFTLSLCSARSFHNSVPRACAPLPPSAGAPACAGAAAGGEA